MYDRQLDDLAALKVPNSPDPDQIDSVRNELRRLAEVDHPAIVRIRDGDIAEGYLVMPLYEGNLQDLLEEDREEVRDRFYELVNPLVEALRAAHSKSVLHRDIKPQNILYRRDGISLSLALSDFGIAKRTTDSVADTPIGTLKYMAPETLYGSEYDERADIYSLGVTFYEMLIGEWTVNFASGGLGALITSTDAVDFGRDRLKPELSALLQRMTMPDCDRRIRSALQVRDELSVWDPGAQDLLGVDDAQARIAYTYSEQNDGVDAVQAIARAAARATAIVNLLKYELSGQEMRRVVAHLRWLFAWLCTCATTYSLSLSECIWSKYPSICPYCESASCGCGRYSLDQKAELLRRIYTAGAGLRSAAPNHSLSYYSNMFDGIYGHKNSGARDLELAYQLATEIGEIQTLALRRNYLRGLDSNLLVAQEVGDAIAWLLALCKSIDVDVTSDLGGFFAQGCPRCNSKPRCRCGSEDLDLVGDEWDVVLDILKEGQS